MIPFEKDLIRFFSTRDKIQKKKAEMDKHLSYCKRVSGENITKLTTEQQKEIRDYWGKISFAYPVSTEWHQLYSDRSGVFSAKYIPKELHYFFVEYGLIKFDYLRAFTDKNYLDLLFSEIKQPPTVVRCIQGLYYDSKYSPISFEEACALMCENAPNGIVIKHSIHSWGGKGISFFKQTMDTPYAQQVLSEYGKNFIVQKVISQHPALAAIHSESINTMRIITILLDGELMILSACLRMGVGGSQVDNVSQGGVSCGIREDGRLRDIGHDRFGNKVLHHPNGFHFEDCVVPNYDTVLDAVKLAAMRVPQFGVASWDFAVDETGTPVLIEYNVGKGGIDIHQFNNGPLYGDKTEKIIDHVFKNYCLEDTTLQYNYNVFCDHVTVKTGSKQMPWIHIRKTHHNLPVTRVGQKAFEAACLRTIRVPRGVTHIDYCAFYKCKRLRRVILPDGLKVVGRSVFNGCTSLRKIRLPKTIDTIGSRAFKDIENLKIYIPAEAVEIADDAFEGCSSVHMYCKENSCAHKYAIQHGFKVTYMS